MTKNLISLARKLIFKYGEDEPITVKNPLRPTLRSPINENIINENIKFPKDPKIPQFGPESPYKQYELPSPNIDPFDPMDIEPKTPKYDESALSPLKQKLIYVLHKMGLNNLIEPAYVKQTYDKIVSADSQMLINILNEFNIIIKELEEEQKFFHVTINEIKRFLNKLNPKL